MAKSKQTDPSPSDREVFRCPKCGSENIGGLMAAFWVAIDNTGAPIGGWQDWEAETELGPERICYECDHKW